MTRLRAAIIGTGLISGKKHIPAFLREKSRVELVALCDLNLQAAQKAASIFGIPKAYSDLSEMLHAEKLDLVDVCTPPQTHAQLAVEIMKQGCHVLIEKPMALTIQDCDEIVHASGGCGVKVCIAHSDLFYRPFMTARELVVRGEVGDFRGMHIFLSTPADYITSHEDHWAHRLPGGIVGETGPHAVYMTLAFINPIREVNVDAVKLLDFPWSRFEDYRIDLIGDKGISSITLSYATDQWMARMDVLGSKGILMVDFEGRSIIKYRRSALKPISIGLSLLNESTKLMYDLLSNSFRFAMGRLLSPHDILIQKFIDSILNGTEPPVTVEEGREAVRVTNDIVNRLQEKFG